MNPRIQIIAIAASIGVMLIVFELIRRRKLREEYSFLWFGASICLIVVSVWRGSLEVLADWTGVAYPPSVVLLAFIGFGLILALHYSVSLSRLADENKRLAQEIALLRHQLDQAGGAPAFGSRPESTDDRLVAGAAPRPEASLSGADRQ